MHWHRADVTSFFLGKWHKETDPVHHAVILKVFSHAGGKHASSWFTPAALRSVVPSPVV